MSIGLTDLARLGVKNPGSASFSSRSGSGVASLQLPQAQQTAANSTSASSNIPGINQIEMPDWLSTNADDNLGELLDTYAKIPGAFDPSGQVKARNDAIAYNTTSGGQAANNAATEFSNRAAQSGASQLGAGVVKAQAMMPVLAQNAALKTDAADVAAKSHQQAATLASQIAGTIGELRQGYLATLTGYAQGQQNFALNKYKSEQDVASSAAQRQLGYDQLSLEEQKLSASRGSEARLAATTVLNNPFGESGSWTTDRTGQVDRNKPGAALYDRYKSWGDSRAKAMQALGGMF